MRVFGGFRHQDEFFHGEVRGEEVHRLTTAPWLRGEADGSMFQLRDLQFDLPVCPSKLIAVDLNYADHIAEMKRTPLGTPVNLVQSALFTAAAQRHDRDRVS